MTGSPMVSVVIPVYNNAAHVRKAIDSVLGQDYRPLEVIVVDDGSTDETPGILESYGGAIRVLEQENAGAAAARNAGISAAQGELIAFLDADDYWLPGKLNIQVAYLQRNPDVGLVYNAWKVIAEDEATAPDASLDQDRFAIEHDKSGWIYPMLLEECIIHTSSAVLRRSVAEATGPFDVKLRRGQDYDYWLRVSRITEIHKLRAVLSIYRQPEPTETARVFPINYGIEVLSRALRKWGRTGPDGQRAGWSKTRRILAMHWLSFGYGHYQHGNTALASKAAIKSLLQWPIQVRSWRMLLLCLYQSSLGRLFNRKAVFRAESS